jgi:hypothetical protein
MAPYDFTRFREQQRQRGSVPLWPNDYARYSRCVNLPGLTSANLGAQRFHFVLRRLRQALQTIAPKDHFIEATYDEVTMEHTGYRVLLRDQLAATRVRICYDHVMEGRQPPLSGPKD